MNNEFKPCIVCKESKQLTEFHKNLNKDGRFNVCKKCHYVRNHARRQDPKNRERFAQYRRSNVMFRRYGITLEEYSKMVHNQENKCLICKESPDPNADHKQRSLHIDHCHFSGKIRGLLCHLCNRAMGLFRDRIDLIEKAAVYLRKHN